jgi:hypothetical protein
VTSPPRGPDAPARAGVGPSRIGWIESPGYDLGLLILPLLAGPLLAVLIRATPGAPDSLWSVLFALTLFCLGIPHYLSSYSFYLDDANARYYRTRAVAFYVGPVVAAALVTLFLWLRFYNLVNATVDVWNVYHVSRQSYGILALYRRLAGGDTAAERVPANLALLGLNAGTFALTAHEDRDVAYFLGRLPEPLPALLGPGLLAAGAVGLITLVRRMRGRPARPTAAECVFLGASILLFTPFVIVDHTYAGGAMLVGHYVQYLGLIWLLNRRKYAQPSGSAAQRALGWTSRRLGALVPTLLALGGVAAAFHYGALGRGAIALDALVFNVIVILHFYVDGLCWALRHARIREGIAPFLVLPDRRRSATPALASGGGASVRAGVADA